MRKISAIVALILVLACTISLAACSKEAGTDPATAGASGAGSAGQVSVTFRMLTDEKNTTVAGALIASLRRDPREIRRTDHDRSVL